MTMPIPAATDVLIIGAGPTGLALAISLAQAGVDHILVDKLEAGHTTSRANVIHAHTLEALQTLGVAERLGARGKQVNYFSIRDRDATLLRLRFDDLPSAFSYLLMVPQDVTEGVLAQRLSELGSCIHRGVTATSVEAGRDGVRAWLEQGGARRAVDAKYVVGADGMHSLVRQAASITFEGESYEHSFVLADVSMEWALGHDEVMLFFSPAGPVVVAPLPNGNFRIVAAMSAAPERPCAADIQGVLDASGPSDGARITGVVWSSRFRIHHRLARRYRRGRLLIMGDAAHVHSPAGGQGMNCGLVDATVLGRLLSSVVSEGQSDRVLDQYERLRRPAAAKVLKLAGDLTAMAMQHDPVARAMRNARLSMMNHVRPIKRKMIMNLSGLSRRAAAEVRL